MTNSRETVHPDYAHSLICPSPSHYQVRPTTYPLTWTRGFGYSQGSGPQYSQAMTPLTLPPALAETDDTAALGLLRTYYTTGTSYAAGVAYTGALFDTWAGEGARTGPSVNGFCADDLVAVTFLSVQVRPRAAAILLDQQVDRYNEMLARVEANRDLIDVTEGEITSDWPAWQLHDALRELPDVGWVIAGKLLARKRPRLVPIYDSVVRTVVRHPDNYWEALRLALCKNGGALHDRLLRLRELAGLSEQVSALRIFDVVAWMSGTTIRQQNRE